MKESGCLESGTCVISPVRRRFWDFASPVSGFGLVTSRWLRGQGRFPCWSEGAAEREMAARIPKLGPVIHMGCFGQQAARVGRSVPLLLC